MNREVRNEKDRIYGSMLGMQSHTLSYLKLQKEKPLIALGSQYREP